MALIDSTLENGGIAPSFLIHKLRYSVSIRPRNNFSVFTFNPASNFFCKTVSRTFIFYTRSYLVITSMPSIYSRIMLNCSIFGIYFIRRYCGYCNPPYTVFGTRTFPMVVRYYRSVRLQGITRCDNTSCLILMTSHA